MGNKKPRKNMTTKDLKSFIENITYGEMREIAKDKRKLDIIEEVHREFSILLNDIDCLSKEPGGVNFSQS